MARRAAVTTRRNEGYYAMYDDLQLLPMSPSIVRSLVWQRQSRGAGVFCYHVQYRLHRLHAEVAIAVFLVFLLFACMVQLFLKAGFSWFAHINICCLLMVV
jgi:hypothetical protein